MKSQFIDIIKAKSPEELRRFISEKGKGPKLIEPMIIIENEHRFNLNKYIKGDNENGKEVNCN